MMKKKSWCGRDISMGFAFQNIQSAQNAVAQGSRLTICHECWTKIQDKLDEGIENIKAFRIPLLGGLMAKEELKDYNNIYVRMNNAERIVREMWKALYGQGYELANHHLNGDLESLDNWFEENDWELVENE